MVYNTHAAWLGTAAAYVRLNRLLRLGRVAEFTQRAESRTNYPNALRVGILGVVVVLAIHWNARRARPWYATNLHDRKIELIT